MAESIISDLAVELISKLGSFAFNEIGVCWGLSDEIGKLKRTVGTIEAVLLHAEEQAIENPQVKHWLGLLSEALYDADDLLDEFSLEALRQQVMGGSEFSKKVRLFFSSSNQLAFSFKMGHKVKALREKLDEIAAEKNKFHLEVRPFVESLFVSKVRDQTHSSPPHVVVGREHDKELIVELLLSLECAENVSVVSIVGIGGLGKTTLAQMVYNDDRVRDHFELKMWVCVSDDFDVQLLVKNVIESATGMAPSSTQMDVLKNHLHEKINGRRYLLVLDDVWNQDVKRWSSFKEMLDGGARGSKIVITTRLRTVSEMSRPITAHELSGLSENESWSLFKQIAFKQEQPPNPSLEAMGKQIVSKCCGVPLAIKTIGGMLYFKDSESDWLLFKDKELSAIDVYKNDILPILKLSYNHLPSHYKHCFAYCSLYPKDFHIPIEELIHLWKAQGYLKSANSNECLYDVGFGYFMDLFKLSFFQDVKRDDFGNIMSCNMHDLMHDLAMAVAGENIYASHSRMTSIKNNVKHVSFEGYPNYRLQYVPSLFEAKQIRTILSLSKCSEIDNEKIDGVFRNLRNLRVLDLSTMKINWLPNSIYKLKHLRYLDLSFNHDLRKLPKSITNLQNLEVLKLYECFALVKLPKNITKLVNLTDLNNSCCFELSYMPRGIGKLTRLEKLSEFVIAKDHSISNNIGELDELQSLNNLRGELVIQNLRYVNYATSKFTKAHLNLKQKLQELTLLWGEHENENNNEEMVMEALCPHPNLKNLNVWDYGGVKPPSWLPSISSLVSIIFQGCKSIKWLPPLDQLPHLKKLWIVNFAELESVDVETGGGSSIFFPSLTVLAIRNCPKLKGFERLYSLSIEELPCFPSLSCLAIQGCPDLTYLPRFQGLIELYLGGNRIESLMETVKMKTSSASQSTLSPLSQLQLLYISSTKDSPENEFLQDLPSLQHLRFFNCSFRNMSNDEMQWKSLKVLSSIEFHIMENLVALPTGLQYVTTLQHLEITSCPRLECLPDWLPELVALQDLTINRCSLLQERCMSNIAEDWPKISHIPNIKIGYHTIQRNGCYLL